MKKIFLVLITLLLFTGCTLGKKDTPKKAVETYLMKYQKNDDDIVKQLDEDLKKETYSDSQKQKYKDILLKQYSDLKYNIIEDVENGDDATVTVEITVYDLYKTQKNAALYLSSNKNEFNDDTGIYNKDKYLDYKLDQMKDTTDKVNYTVSFTLSKKDEEWQITNLDNDMLEKIHGIYNYEQS